LPRVALTDRFVAGARTAGRENYFDTKIRGLTLRVAATSKTWAFVYRAPGKPSQWLALGTYPAVPLVEARKLAGTYRHQVDVEKRDPAAEARAAKAVRNAPPAPPPAAKHTFADFVPAYLAFARARGKKTVGEDAQKIRKYLAPAWNALPLRDITRRHVAELLTALAGNGLTVGVNRMQALISRVFTVAINEGLVDAHPAARMIKRFTEQPRMRTLTDDEIRALSEGLAAQPGPAADALWLRLRLGQRGGEVAGLLWAEVDLKAALWTLPAARTKNRRAHVVPLPPKALALVTARRATLPADEPRVFPGLTLTSPEHKLLAVIHGGAYTWTDLRRTCATGLARLGYSETVIGRTLNHARHTVTAKHYDQHPYLDESRAALTAWEGEIERIIRNEAPARRVLRHTPRRR
jgi:integrase